MMNVVEEAMDVGKLGVRQGSGEEETSTPMCGKWGADEIVAELSMSGSASAALILPSLLCADRPSITRFVHSLTVRPSPTHRLH